MLGFSATRPYGHDDPKANREDMDVRKGVIEDRVIIEEPWPGLLLPECTRAHCCGEVELTQSLRTMSQTKELDGWLHFGIQIFLDIIQCFGDQAVEVPKILQAESVLFRVICKLSLSQPAPSNK